MAESRYCNVTVENHSKYKLINAKASSSSGKWEYPNGNSSNPPSNVGAGETVQFQLTGKSISATGAAGSVLYGVYNAEAGAEFGTVTFSFACPYDYNLYSNEASISVDTNLLIASFYCGHDGSSWGAEGGVPRNGEPLYIKYVLKDL
jgi:hypothetical protein